jgi:hypothetical protein
MVSGCVGFLRDFALTFGRCLPHGRFRAQSFKNLSSDQPALRRRRSRSRLPSPQMLSPVNCQDDDVISGYAKVHGVRNRLRIARV